MNYDILQKSGAWFSYNGEKIGQGREAVRAYLKSNEALANELEAKIRAKMYGKEEEAA